jgi:hypothetical protein
LVIFLRFIVKKAVSVAAAVNIRTVSVGSSGTGVGDSVGLVEGVVDGDGVRVGFGEGNSFMATETLTGFSSGYLSVRFVFMATS